MTWLVLHRQQGQEIKIGDNITIRVGEIGHSKVQLCIAAPKGVLILRDDAKVRDGSEKPYRTRPS